MAASNPAPRSGSSADDAAESAVGMAHLTVVPTNFEPADSSDCDE
ncbi:hypothetical protein ACFR99_00790 [Haloarchaeobius amylolyticus]|uniref:Uncharacterized protein n=1 Tax=Haloarchaeobius amylolyticus TaxID=1198296 RepID=A0ABD6BAX3_9EURY